VKRVSDNIFLDMINGIDTVSKYFGGYNNLAREPRLSSGLLNL
jgi:hypothetical protein